MRLPIKLAHICGFLGPRIRRSAENLPRIHQFLMNGLLRIVSFSTSVIIDNTFKERIAWEKFLCDSLSTDISWKIYFNGIASVNSMKISYGLLWSFFPRTHVSSHSCSKRYTCKSAGFLSSSNVCCVLFLSYFVTFTRISLFSDTNVGHASHEMI